MKQKDQLQNYQFQLEEQLKRQGDWKPRLLLHACCAPCSSYCLEYLRDFYHITVYYYNPNITSREEYAKRTAEELRLIDTFNRQLAEKCADGVQPSQKAEQIAFQEGAYEPERFTELAGGYEQCPEGGERCFRCYELRLRESAKAAAIGGFDFFTTTLTISPLKNADKLNEIGCALATEYGISFLPSDFKKKGGYQRSIELSKKYDLYRQDYCGCAYSKAEREQQKAIKRKNEEMKK